MKVDLLNPFTWAVVQPEAVSRKRTSLDRQFADYLVQIESRDKGFDIAVIDIGPASRGFVEIVASNKGAD